MTPLMQQAVTALLTTGKGILALDESLPTIEKRFKSFGIPCTAELRRDYREMLIKTPGLGRYISGVILFEETLDQKTVDDIPIPEYLRRHGMVPGIKVDQGTIPWTHSPGETITQGLDGLRDRLSRYRKLGARFTKWRAVMAITDDFPSTACIDANARAMGRFAALSQEEGLVPIVEPEVLMDGNHDIERCEKVTTRVLKSVFSSLSDHRVALEAILLKTGMVLSGRDCPHQVDVETVAVATRRCLRRCVPTTVPGIAFLSGGQDDTMATQRLNVICGTGDVPWTLSFSFGRALQSSALATWKGNADNLNAAQAVLQHRAASNALAILGQYSTTMERVAS